MVDQLVEIENVDLAGVQPDEPFPSPVQEQPQLLLVISGNQGSRLPTTGALAYPINGRLCLIHPTEATSRPPVTIMAWNDLPTARAGLRRMNSPTPGTEQQTGRSARLTTMSVHG